MASIRRAHLVWKRVEVVKEDSVPYERLVRNSAEVTAVIRSLIGAEVTECFIVILLNVRNKIIGYHEAGRGGVDQCVLKTADVFRAAIMAGAGSVILAHNHPSGDATPSEHDMAFTVRCVKASEILGIRVLDHIIVADDATCSFCDMGLLNKIRSKQ
jgi:DNA repair protein RadC